MTDLIKRINFIDPSFNTSKPEEIECVAILDSFCTSIALKKENKVIGLNVFDHKTKIDIWQFHFIAKEYEKKKC